MEPEGSLLCSQKRTCRVGPFQHSTIRHQRADRNTVSRHEQNWVTYRI